MKKRIFLITDDMAVCRSIQENMKDTWIDTCYMRSLDEILLRLAGQEYHLIIIDIQQITASTLDTLCAIRKVRMAPILARIDGLSSEEKVTLFYAGADVCIDKSSGTHMCVAQADALIKLYMEFNTGYQQLSFLSFGSELVISPRYRQVIIDGTPLVLTRKEFDLLHFLASNPQQVLSREQLYQHVWQEDVEFGGEGTVKTHISTLRKKLAAAGKNYIDNIWGVGYKFTPPPIESN